MSLQCQLKMNQSVNCNQISLLQTDRQTDRLLVIHFGGSTREVDYSPFFFLNDSKNTENMEEIQ